MTNEHAQVLNDSPKATWREWLGLVPLTLALFMLATDMTILFLAMPSIAADLAPSATQMLWIIHIGELLAVGFFLTMGRLGDRIGRKRLLIIGVTVYGLSSIVAAFSTEPWMLIASRALLGVASATVMPSTMSLLRNMFFDQKQFSVAIAIVMSSYSAGMALGPPIGGLLLDHFWWGAVFLVNVPAVLILLVTAPLLPEYSDKKSPRMDLVSVLLSSLALITFIYALQEIANHGFKILYVVLIAVSIAIGFLFINRQLHTKDPLLDLYMFKTPLLTYSLIARVFLSLLIVGESMLFAQHLQVIGLTPTEAGLLLIIPAIFSIIGTLVSPLLTRWMRPTYAMVSNLLIAGIGAFLLALTVQNADILLLMIGASLMGIGVGPTITIASDQIISSVPQERAGTASALSDVSSGLGSVLSVAIIGSIGMLVYRWNFTNAIPAGVPSEIANSAMESVGTALAVSDGLPEMLQAIRFSSTIALQSVYGFVSIGFLALIIFVLWKLRYVR
ncbi:MFS transporter [Paenibacillus gorillae]|uniref:MFS transporter n=1 Tax=Paenibacillus gorillae TaxID=1243662 RepID=UPI0004B564A8|nr:MFS transporter [Paenibacillus gorillae]